MPPPVATTLADDLPGPADPSATPPAHALDAASVVRLVALWPLALIAVVALISRLRYIVSYDGAYGSGDAHLVLTRALFVMRGDFSPPATVGAPAGVFADPPLIPLALAGVAKATPVSLEHAPLALGPFVAVLGLLALYGVLCRAFDRTTAVVATVLVALLPRFAFDSTEPDKAVYVVASFLVSLWCLYEARESSRRSLLLLASGLAMGLSVFAHTTALLFLPVYALSYAALFGLSRRSLLRPALIAACATIVAFVAAFVLLDDAFGPSPSPALLPAAGESGTRSALPPGTAASAPDTLAPPADTGTRFVPSRVEEYWTNFKGLAGRGFRDSAWTDYTRGIRDQLLDPVFALALAGFALATWRAFARRELRAVPLLVWLAVVTIGFAIQRPAASHATRYPSYVTPVFLVFAAWFVVWAARQAATKLDLQPAYGIALAAPALAYMAFSYATAPDPGLRPLYEPHGEVAAYVNEQGLLSEDARLLYLAWPSYTFHLLDGGAEMDTLRTLGWQPMDIGRYDFDGERIRYYAFDDTSDDYYATGERIASYLARTFDLRTVETFCVGDQIGPTTKSCAGRVSLIEVLGRKSSTAP